MRAQLFVLLILTVIINTAFSGCTWFSEDSQYAEGFEGDEINVPLVPAYPPHSDIPRPEENTSQLPPGFSYNLSWSMADVFPLWGGFISIGCENTGDNDIFVYRYGVSVNWSFPSQWIYAERNVLVPVGSERQLGIVYVKPPDILGNYSYDIIISILVKDNELFDDHGIESWYDNGTVHSKEKILNLTPTGELGDADIIHNHKHYHERVNERVDFEDVVVMDLASGIVDIYPGGYNIYQVLAVYDYILNNLTYIPDPGERDYWCNPMETLERGGGDCEDFSLFFSSLIGALGGTTRVYLTQTHAFSVLYIGNESTKDDILEAIGVYYGTSPNFVIFQDKVGFWVAADPAGSWYLGGLPADATPAVVSGPPLRFDYGFHNTTKIHIIDVTG